jgi:abortive infection bacteriophage resistance protein
MKYAKPYLDIQQQISLLQQRGLTVTDEAKAGDYLRRIGYYRLSAYWYPLRRSSLVKEDDGRMKAVIADDFRPGSEFPLVLDLYVFDKKLRLLVLDALERIEVALRTDVALLLGRKDPWAHRNPDMLHGNFAKKLRPDTGRTAHAEWLEKLDGTAARSREEFAQHFRRKYAESPLPIWMAVELLEFGALSHFLAGMTVADQEALAARYGLARRELLTSWVRTLTFVRNVCAHHGRLWNRTLIDHPKPPHPGEVPELDHLATDHFAQGRLYAAMAIIRFMLKVMNPATSWAERLKAHVTTFPRSPVVPFASSGFPDGWETLPLWR